MTELVTLSDPKSPVAEAYRSLRTNLAFARPDEQLRTLLVTSPAAEEDRSPAVANLAVVTAQSGRSVIAVDCDLRRPHLHKLFGLDCVEGVTTALLGESGQGEIPLQDTDVEGLKVLCSGPIPPNPAELLGSQRMESLIADLSSRADFVLFDAPPVVPVTDAAILAPQLDGVLLVLTAGKSRRDQTERARDTLDKVGARLLGVVLTEVEPDASTYGYYGAE